MRFIVRLWIAPIELNMRPHRYVCVRSCTLLGRCFDGWLAYIREQQRLLRRAAHALGPGRLLYMSYASWRAFVRNAHAERARASFSANFGALLVDGIEEYMRTRLEDLTTMSELAASLEHQIL